MLWVFVCVGLVTLVAALYELVRAMHFNRLWAIPHACAVLLLAVAWFAGHTTAIGTVALFVALFVEVLCKLHGGPAGDIWEEPRETETPSDETAEPIAPGAEATPDDTDSDEAAGLSTEAEPAPDSDEPEASDAESLPDATPGDDADETKQATEEAPEETEDTTQVIAPWPAPAIDDAAPEGDRTSSAPAIAEPDVADDSANTDAPTEETGVEATPEDTAASDETIPEAAPAEPEAEPEPDPEPELPQIRIVPAFSTCILLRSPWDASAIEVFLASLRRGGRREAKLLENGGSEFPVIGLGDMMIELRPKAERLPREQIEFGLAHSWDWPEGPDAVKAHKACVVFTTYPCEERSREDIVLLHRDAHLALAEFAHVVAAFWMDAGRFVDIPHIRAAQEADALRATDLCITYRTFPLEGDQAGFVLSDTVGLYAFGLPDFQIICEGDPDETISAMLYHLAEGCFAEGPGLESGARISTSDGTHWDVRHVESRFPPERVVTELCAVPPKTDTPDTESETPTPELTADPHEDPEAAPPFEENPDQPPQA